LNNLQEMSSSYHTIVKHKEVIAVCGYLATKITFKSSDV